MFLGPSSQVRHRKGTAEKLFGGLSRKEMKAGVAPAAPSLLIRRSG